MKDQISHLFVKEKITSNSNEESEDEEDLFSKLFSDPTEKNINFTLNEDLFKSFFLNMGLLGFSMQSLIFHFLKPLAKLMNLDFEESPFEYKICNSFLQNFPVWMTSLLEKTVEKQEDEAKLTYFIIFLLELYRTSPVEVNITKTSLFNPIYTEPTNKDNKLTMKFFYESSKFLKNLKALDNKTKFMPKILVMMVHDLSKKLEFFQQNPDKKMFIDDCVLFFEFLENFDMVITANFDGKFINEMVAIIFKYIYMIPELKQIFFDKKLLSHLCSIKSASSFRLSEVEYLDSFFKFLEFLCFDKEYKFVKYADKIINMFYNLKEEKFKKHILPQQLDDPKFLAEIQYEHHPQFINEILRGFFMIKKGKKSFKIYLNKGF